MQKELMAAVSKCSPAGIFFKRSLFVYNFVESTLLKLLLVVAFAREFWNIIREIFISTISKLQSFSCTLLLLSSNAPSCVFFAPEIYFGGSAG